MHAGPVMESGYVRQVVGERGSSVLAVGGWGYHTVVGRRERMEYLAFI